MVHARPSQNSTILGVFVCRWANMRNPKNFFSGLASLVWKLNWLELNVIFPSLAKMLGRPFSDACIFAIVTPRHLSENVEMQVFGLIPNMHLFSFVACTQLKIKHSKHVPIQCWPVFQMLYLCHYCKYGH